LQLLKIPIKSFNQLSSLTSLTEEQKHGMARFFSGRDFNKKETAQKKELSSNLKSLLLVHLVAFGDKEKIDRFKESTLTNT
jgi:hypothetical protein